MRIPFRRFLATGAIVCTVPMFLTNSAFASTIFGAAAPYNVFVLNNFTASNSDVEGGLAAGGNINIGSYSVASSINEAQAASQFPLGYTLVAGGGLTASSGTLSAGNAYGSTTNVSSFNLSGGTLNTGGSQVINFQATDNQIDSDSTFLASLATTAGDSCTLAYSTTTCTAAANNLNIINVTDPTMFAGKTININSTGSNATLVINVAGSADSLGGAGFTVFNNGVTVLFNYYQASTLALGSSTFSVLAPFASVTGSSGSFNGTLIAGSFSGPTEFESADLFSGNLPAQTPEPGSLVLAGAALTLIGLTRRKRIGS